mgnify:CR=1 FL=1
MLFCTKGVLIAVVKSRKRVTNLSIFAMREKMKQKSFDPCSFFRVASTVIVELEVLYHNSSVSVASAKAQVSITTLLQYSRTTAALANITFFVLLNNTQYSRFSFYTDNFIAAYQTNEKKLPSLFISRALSL